MLSQLLTHTCLQEFALARDEMPQTLDGAEAAIKKHEAFVASMDANEERINGVVELGEKLVADGNFFSDKISEKVNSIRERYFSVSFFFIVSWVFFA